MKKEEILNNIRKLASSQGFYSRLFALLNSDEPDAIAYLEYLEEQNFKDTVDLIMFLED